MRFSHFQRSYDTVRCGSFFFQRLQGAVRTFCLLRELRIITIPCVRCGWGANIKKEYPSLGRLDPHERGCINRFLEQPGSSFVLFYLVWSRVGTLLRGGPWLIRPTVHTKTYIFTFFLRTIFGLVLFYDGPP